MAVNPSIQLGTSGNWAIKEDNLLAYKQLGSKFFNREFDFSRGTSATFVGRNGLIQESGLTDTELVTNGNFSQEGSQLVTNGDFATDTNWSKEAGWTISDGKANANVTGTQAIYQSGITLYKWYKVTYTISDYVSGDVRLRVGTTSIPTVRSSNGTFTEYLYATGTNQVRISPFTNGFNGSIDNVSVKEVGQDWTLGTGWSIGTNKATSDASVSSYLNQTLYTIGNLYKLKFEVLEGTIELRSAQYSKGTGYYTTGTHEIEVIPTTTSTYFYVYTGFGQSSITNISVIEIQTDVPRIDFTDDTTGHLLLEPQSTNLQTYSSNLASVYVPTNITQTSNYGISPDGSSTSTRLVLGNLTDSRSVETFTGVVISGNTYTFSAYYKGVSGQTTYMYFLSSTGGTSISKQITFNGNWQRESITFTAGSASNYTYTVDVRQGSSTATDFEVWGAQVEEQSFATSYIPTSGSTVTRNQEICNNSGTASDFNSEEGVLYAEIAALANDLTNRKISISNGSSTQRILLSYSTISNALVFQVVNSTLQVNLSYILTDIKLLTKVAVKWKLNDFSFWVNGVEVAIDSSGLTPIGLTELSFDRGFAGENFYGKTKNLKVFKRALTDAELYLLTVTQYQSYQEMATALNYTL